MLNPMMDESVQESLQAVSGHILGCLDTSTPILEDLHKRFLDRPGKRIRATMTLICAKACGYLGTKDTLLAAIVELMHMATLLHDDVIDNSTTRRGQKTLNHEWGNQNAILVGDLLYVKSFEQLITLNNPAILQTLTHTSYQLVLGEIQQLSQRLNFKLTEQAYFDIIEAKTASLFSGASQSAALLCNAPPTIEKAMTQFGKHIGLAFQLADDLLDYQANPQAHGKKPYNDLQEGKLTLPVIHALRIANTHQTSLIHQAFDEPTESNIENLLTTLNTLGSFGYVQQKAQNEISQAQQHLQALPASSYQRSALDLTTFILERVEQFQNSSLPLPETLLS